MADNSITLELNITARDTKKNINEVTAALKRMGSQSQQSVAKFKTMTQAFRSARKATTSLSSGLQSVIDKFEQIAASAGYATSSIRSFTKAAKSINKSSASPADAKSVGLQTAVTPATPVIKEESLGMDSTALQQATEAAEEFSYANYKVVSAMTDVKQASESAAQAINPYTTYLNESTTAGYAEINAMHGVTGSYKAQKPEVKSLGSVIKETTAKVKEHASAFSTLWGAVKRIAFYRAIRSAIKAVTQAFREGVSNLYQYSAALNSLDAARAKNTMDGFATTALYVKNSLGAALMPVLQTLLPIVNAIADAFVAAANAINQFFHALKGESVFTKAKRYTTEFGDALDSAAGSAKELKKQVFGFDELNIFNSPSGGGGGGGSGLDFSQMFEEADIDGIFKRIRDRIEENLGKEFNAKFKINFTEFFTNWGDLTGEDIANKILGSLFGLLFGITGFTLGGVPGAVIGSLLGVSLGIFFSTVSITPDGVLTQEEVGEMMRYVAATFTGAVVGWVVGGAGGALLGASIGASLAALIKTFAPKPDATLEGLTVMGFFGAVIAKMIAGATGVKVGAAAIGGIPMFVVAGITLSVMSLLWNHGYKDTRQAVGMAIAEVINVVAGAAIIGAAFGGLGGALIGIAIGVSINLLVNKIDWSAIDAVSKRAQEYADSQIDIQAMENYLGSPASTGKTINGKKIPQSILKGEANGGFVPAGTYFYAGEPGNPELVGSVGGRTHVINQDQFTGGMETIMDNTNTVILQAAQALIEAVRNIPVPSVVVGDRDIVTAYDRGKTLAGGALVE